MADEYLNTSVGEPLEPVEPPKKGLAGFVSTRRGRLVAGALAAFGLFVVAGIVVSVFVFPSQTDAADPLAPPAGAVSAPGSAVPVSDEETVTPPATAPLSETFAFRDIFVPTVKPEVAPESSDTTGTGDTDGEDNGSTSVPANTLLLEDTSEVDGEPVATFTWNGQEYTVGEGDQLGDSPWQVVDISGDTVVMLYGDNRVTLTVGQGITK